MQTKKKKENYNYQNHLLVSGQEIEEVPALMCYIQLSLLGIAGYFKVGNSLTKPMTMADDLKNYWFTPIYFSDVWTMRRLFHSIWKFMRRDKREWTIESIRKRAG